MVASNLFEQDLTGPVLIGPQLGLLGDNQQGFESPVDASPCMTTSVSPRPSRQAPWLQPSTRDPMKMWWPPSWRRLAPHCRCQWPPCLPSDVRVEFQSHDIVCVWQRRASTACPIPGAGPKCDDAQVANNMKEALPGCGGRGGIQHGISFTSRLFSSQGNSRPLHRQLHPATG
jgi:hypothetical protein